MLLADTLPESSFALMEHAARLTQKVVAILRDAVADGEAHRLPALATALNNLGIRLSEVGQRQAALGPAQEAGDIYRELAAKAPDAYRPDLAMALNNLAIRLSEVGQRQAALAPAQEAASCTASWRRARPMPIGPLWRGPQQPGQALERGRPAPGGARAGAGGGRHTPRAAASAPDAYGPLWLRPSTTWPIA